MTTSKSETNHSMIYHPGMDLKSRSTNRTGSTLISKEILSNRSHETWDDYASDDLREFAKLDLARKDRKGKPKRKGQETHNSSKKRAYMDENFKFGDSYRRRTTDDIERGVLKNRQSLIQSQAHDRVPEQYPAYGSEAGSNNAYDLLHAGSSVSSLDSQSSKLSAMSKTFHPGNVADDSRFFAPPSNISTHAVVDPIDTLPDMEELHYFEKHKELGTGTDAYVYEVIDRRDKSHVAMKLTKRKSGRYRTEINLLHSLRTCPFIVTLLNVLENQSVYVLMLEQAPMTMENLLHERCTDEPMQERVGRDIIESVLKGIKVIHNLGFVHKDIKPENVLIFADREKRKLQAKIADFGFATRVRPSQGMLQAYHSSNISNSHTKNGKKEATEEDLKDIDDELTEYIMEVSTEHDLEEMLNRMPKPTVNEFLERVSDKCGTPGFWAPELVAGTVELKYAFRMDVFSAGVTLYRMLCNEMAFGLFETWEVKTAQDGTKKLAKMKPNFHVVSWKRTLPKYSSREDGYNSSHQSCNCSKRTNGSNCSCGSKPKYDYIRKLSKTSLTPACLDLLRGMLRIRPHRRNTIDMCLKHDWISRKKTSRS